MSQATRPGAGTSGAGTQQDQEATPKGLPTSDRYDAETAHVDETHDPRKTADRAGNKTSHPKGG